MKKDTNDRKLELSSKFVEMGEALNKEGSKEGDYSISQSGNVMLLLSGLILDDKDFSEFSYLCSLFTSKKTLEGIERDNLSKDESYSDFLKRIKRLRDDLEE
jgi:hypothetical protein